MKQLELPYDPQDYIRLAGEHDLKYGKPNKCVDCNRTEDQVTLWEAGPLLEYQGYICTRCLKEREDYES